MVTASLSYRIWNEQFCITHESLHYALSLNLLSRSGRGTMSLALLLPIKAYTVASSGSWIFKAMLSVLLLA